MKQRYLFAGVGVFFLLLLTLLASVFGWGLPAPSGVATMIANPHAESTTHAGGHFHLWHPVLPGHAPHKGT